MYVLVKHVFSICVYKQFPSLNVSVKGSIGNQQEECWWQKSICSPLFPGSQCSGELILFVHVKFSTAQNAIFQVITTDCLNLGL